MKKILFFFLLSISLGSFAQVDSITAAQAQYHKNVRWKINETIDSLNRVLYLRNVTSSVHELNILDGALVNTTELNRSVGVTSNIQTQIDSKLKKNGVDSIAVIGTMEVAYIGGDTASRYTAYADRLDISDFNAENVQLEDSSGVAAGSYTSGADFYNRNARNYFLEGVNLMSPTIKAFPLAGNSTPMSTGKTFTENRGMGQVYYIDRTMTVTGVSCIMSGTKAAFTSDTSEYSGVALYSISGTTYTKIDSAQSNQWWWKANQYAKAVIPFKNTHVLQPGLYAIIALYTTATPTTVPFIYSYSDIGTLQQVLLGNNHRLCFYIGSITHLKNTYDTSEFSSDSNVFGFWLY
jgi:hypothetical protein